MHYAMSQDIRIIDGLLSLLSQAVPHQVVFRQMRENEHIAKSGTVANRSLHRGFAFSFLPTGIMRETTQAQPITSSCPQLEQERSGHGVSGGIASQLSLTPFEEHLESVDLQKEGGPVLPPASVHRDAAFSLGNAPAQLACAWEGDPHWGGRQQFYSRGLRPQVGACGWCWHLRSACAPHWCQLEIPST